MNYFELFGVEVAFDLNVTALSPVYQQLQKRFHPDKFATSSSQEQLLAVQKTAEINDAYTVLKNPLSRAQYLLGLRGLDMKDEQQTFQDGAFLMQQMVLREAMDEVTDSTDPEHAIEDLEQQAQQLYNQYLQALSAQLNEGNAEADKQAANSVRKLKFVVKLQDEISRLEDSLFED